MADPRRAARPAGTWPFVAVFLLAQVLFGWPVHELPRPGWGAVATVAFVVMVLLAFVGIRTGHRVLSTVVPAYVAIAVVALWRQADGGSRSDFTVMFALPVLWLALHGTLRQLWVSIAAIAAIMLVPLVVVDDAAYPLSDWRRVVLSVAVGALMGPLTRRISRDRAAARAREAASEPARTHLEGVLEASIEHALITTDVSGTITVFNPGAERLFGWTADQAVGRPLDLLLTERTDERRAAGPAPSTSAYESLSIAVLRGLPAAQTWRTNPQVGPPKLLTVTASALRGADHDLAGFVFLASAESDSQAAIEALARQREIYRNLLALLPATVVGVLGRDLRWINLGGQYTGTERADLSVLVGEEMGRTLSPQVKERLTRAVTAAFDDPQHLELEIRPGEWFEFDLSRIPDEHGQARVLVVGRDVSARYEIDAERHRLLEAAVAGEELFRTIFESSPVGKILVSHPDGGPPRFIGVNPAFGRLVGVAPDDLTDVPIVDLVVPEDHGLVLQMQHVKETRTLEMRFRSPSGRVVACEVHCTQVMPQPGEESFVIGQVSDITDRKAAERALLDALERQRAAAESLREADSVRTEVMSTVSHELRTPLTSITGYIELLMEGHAGPLSPEQREMLEVVDRNSRRLQDLVDDLLLLSRLDQTSSHEDLAWEVIDLREIVRRSVDTIRPVAAGRVQTLSVSLGDEPVLVRGDADQLDRALTNLVSNACKYTYPGGRITVGLEAPDHESARLWVSDNGVGIPALEVSRLFTRFFRASSGRVTGASGSGLGLAIVKSLVELHGGRVSVTSEQGIGSTFVLTLPTVRGARPTVPQA